MNDLHKTIRFFFLIVLGILLITACSAAPTAAPEPTQVPTQLPPTVTPQPTATPLPTPTPTPVPLTFADLVIPHPVQDREQCDTCHAQGGALPNPADHEGRQNATCSYCHLTEAGLTTPPDSLSFASVDCLVCHGPFEDLIGKNVQALGEDGNPVNPHMYVPHDTTDMLECSLCHQPHALPQQAESEAAAAVTVEACYDCHHVRNFTNCSQCHVIIPIKE